MKSIKLRVKSFPGGVFIATLVVLTTIWLILNLTAPRIPIFGFHSIIDIQNSDKSKAPNQELQKMEYAKQDLEQLLDYLIAHNFWFLSTQEMYDYFIAKSKKIPLEHIGQRPIMVTFDDSYKTYYTNLLPVLESLSKKYGHKVKVVLFLNPGTLVNSDKKTSYYLTCGNLRSGLKKGFFDIQSHGQNHKKLTSLNTEDLIYELKEAQVQLRKCTADLDPNKTVASHIAYPYGATNQKVEEYASRYYTSGYLYNTRMFKQGWLRSKYQIPRLSVNKDKPPRQLIWMAEWALKIKN